MPVKNWIGAAYRASHQLRELYRVAVRPDVAKAALALAVQGVGLAFQLAALTVLLHPPTAELAVRKLGVFFSPDAEVPTTVLLGLGIACYCVGEVLRFAGKFKATHLIYDYARNILSVLPREDQSRVSQQQASVAFRCALLMRRLLEILPSLVMVVANAIMIVKLIQLSTLAVLLVLTCILVVYQLRIAYTSAKVQTEILRHRKSQSKQWPKPVDGALLNTALNVRKFVLGYDSHFASGIYIISLIIVIVLVEEGGGQTHSLALLALFFLFGNHTRAILSALTVVARLHPALVLFMEIKSGRGMDKNAAMAEIEDIEDDVLS